MEPILKENEGSFYLFDTKTLLERVAYLKSHLPKDVAMCYAVKANTFIIREVMDACERLEICSFGEFTICKKLGVPFDKMVISGINKYGSYIEDVLGTEGFDGILTIESVWQFEKTVETVKKLGKPARVLIRLTNDSQFGVNESEMVQMIETAKEEALLTVVGVQFFSGTQKTSVKKFRREIDKLDELLQRLSEEHGFEAEELEYGTGFPVSYFDPEGFDEDAFLDEVSEILSGMNKKVKITLEIGRSIAASCGEFYTHIVDLKTNKGQNYALIDGGMHQLVYFGQHMGMSIPPFAVVGKEEAPVTGQWNVCGSLCSMNDIVVKQADMPDLEIGDLLCFRNTGAYCVIEGIALFLSRDIPAVYIRQEDGTVICARKTIQTAEINTPNY